MRFFILLLCFLKFQFCMSTSVENIKTLLPDSINEWKKKTEDKLYTPENLYDYIDGGAELYISYGFTEVVSRIYFKENQPEIKVEIFDILGRRVRTLINKEQLPGNYEVQLDASSLSSGIYLYRLRAGGFIDTKKMVLLK